MSQVNVQFAVATHVMAALGADQGDGVRSAELAQSVNADASFVRRVVAKLARAGLVRTTRGKNGACALARPAAQITLLDIYRASEAPATCAVHGYAVSPTCQVSRHIKGCLNDVLQEAQSGFERSLAKQTLSALVRRIDKGK